MKKVLVALVCTLGAVACGEQRPAEDPSTTRSTVTTETTTTGAPRANTATPNATAMNEEPITPRAVTPGTSTTQPSSQPATRSAADASANTPPAAAVAATGIAPATNNPGAANNTKDADNTKINVRDRNGAALTPMDQGGGKDRDITAAIRRAVVSDGALSFTGKNVKIITVGGKVTLRGPVKSDQEKTAIEAKAKSTTGVSDVDNQLEVKK